MIGKHVVIDTLDNFKAKLDLIPSSAIVLIKDVGQIYAHGTYFGAQKTYSLLTKTADGLAPKGGTSASSLISNVDTEWVLTVTNGENPTWRKLPANAFSSSSYTLPSATVSDLGGIKVGQVYTATFNDLVGLYYKVNIDKNGLAYVHVPWVNNPYTASGSGITLKDNVFSLSLNSVTKLDSAIGNKIYAVSLDKNGKLCVSVPWTDTNNIFVGATETKNGSSGMVPAPIANQHNYFLRGDGTWIKPNLSDLNDDVVNGKYLPLSGGTLSAKGSDILCINNTNGNSLIKYQSRGTLLGLMGFNIASVPVVVIGNTYTAIWHEGNFKPSDYLPITGGTISGNLTISSTDYGSQLTIHRLQKNADALIEFSNNGDGIIGYIGVGGSVSQSSKLQPYFSTGTSAYPLIHSGNIGSQSVSYASTTGRLYTGQFNKVTYYPTEIGIEYFGDVNKQEGLFAADNNANGILHIRTHGENFMHQLGFSSNGNIYSRYFSSKLPDTTTSWKRLAFTDSNVASANYASSAGNADTIDNYHTACGFQYLKRVEFSDSTNSVWYVKVVFDVSYNHIPSKVLIRPGYNNTNGFIELEMGSYIMSSGYIAKVYNYNNSNCTGFWYGEQSDNSSNSSRLTLYLRFKGGASAHTYIYSQLSILESSKVSASVGSSKTYVDLQIDGQQIVHNYRLTATEATKLKTARTIWGQSFDGTGNVGGYLKMSNNTGIQWYDKEGTLRSYIFVSNGNNFHVGYGAAISGYNTFIDGYNIIFRYGTTPTEVMRISSSGYVGIGETDPQYKLDVNGSFNATTIYQNGNSLSSLLDTKLNSSSYTASDILTKLKTVDGSGTELDADLLDGQHASAFVTRLGRYQLGTSDVKPYTYVHLFRIGVASGYSARSFDFSIKTRYNSVNFYINISTTQYPYNSGGSSIVIHKEIKSGRDLNIYYVPTINSSGYNYYDVYCLMSAWNGGHYDLINLGGTGTVVFEDKRIYLDSLPTGYTAVTESYVSKATYANEADTLDGWHLSAFYTNDSTTTLGGTTSSPTSLLVRYSNTSSTANSPYSLLGGNLCLALNLHCGNDYMSQLAFNFASDYLAIRRKVGSTTWGGWSKIKAGYADSAGSADKLDNYNSSEFPLLNGIKSGTWNWNDVTRAGYYKILAGTITNHPSGIYNYGMAAVLTTENHADGENRELLLYYPHNQTNNIAIWGRMHNSSTQGNGWGPWWGIPNTEGVKQIIGTYYWANIKISATSNDKTTPTFGNVTINHVPTNYQTPSLNINYNSSFLADEYSISLLKFGNTGMDNYLGVAPAEKTVFGTDAYFFHTSDKNEFNWLSSSWKKLMGLKCSDGTLYVKGNVGIGTANPSEKLQIAGNICVEAIDLSTRPAIYLGHYASWNGKTYPTLKSGATDQWVMHFNPHVCRNTTTGMPGSNIRMESVSSHYWDISVAHDATDNFRIRYDNSKNLVNISSAGLVSLANSIVFTGSVGSGTGTYLAGTGTDGLFLAANESGKKVYLESTNQSCPYFRNKNGDYAIWHAGNDGSGSGLDADLLDGYHASGIWEYGTSLSPYNASSTGWYLFLTLVATTNDGLVDFTVSAAETGNDLGVADYFHFATRPSSPSRVFVYTHLGSSNNYLRNNIYAYTSDNKTYKFYMKYSSAGGWNWFCKIRHIASRGCTITWSDTWQTAAPSGTAYLATFSGAVNYASSAGNSDTVDGYHLSVTSSAGTDSSIIYFVT